MLTVPTHFGDIAELSQGLMDRVDEEKLILYGPDAFEEGSQIDFAILLLDGNAALEGQGRVAASVDGGEERAPETRYDIVIDMLQLEGMSQAVYEGIVYKRQSLMSDEPPTGEVDVADLEEQMAADVADGLDEEMAAAHPPIEEISDESTVVAEDPASYDLPDAEEPAYAEAEVAAEPAYAEAALEEAPADAPEEANASADDAAELPVEEPAAEAHAEEAPVEVGDDDVSDEPAADDDWADADVDALVADGDSGPAAEVGVSALADIPDRVPQPPGPPPGFSLAAVEGVLTRSSRQPSWWPAVEARPEPAGSSDLFAYGGAVPVPAGPPRPDLDPSYRVAPAPRPSSEAPAEAPAYEEAPVEAEASAEEAPAYEEAASAHEEAEEDVHEEAVHEEAAGEAEAYGDETAAVEAPPDAEDYAGVEEAALAFDEIAVEDVAVEDEIAVEDEAAVDDAPRQVEPEEPLE